MQELGIIPDGDLFKMQQKAILEARLAASKSAFKEVDNSINFDTPTSENKQMSFNENLQRVSQQMLHKEHKPKERHKSSKNSSLASLIPFDISNILNRFLKDFGMEEILIIGLIVLMVFSSADLELILGLSFILLSGSL